MFLSRIFLFFSCMVLLGCLDSSGVSQKLTPKLINLGDRSEEVTLSPKLDMLFVIDNSGSMQSYQNNLQLQLAGFLEGILKLPNLDIHIGVTTSDGQARGYVNRELPLWLDELREKMDVGVDGSGTESFFSNIISYLRKDSSFHRPEALLSIIILTDAEDQSNVEDTIYTPSYTRQFLMNLKNGDSERVSTFLAYIPPEEKSGKCPRNGEHPPVRLKAFANLLEGVEASLCDTRFSQKLLALGKDLSQRIRDFKIPLNNQPQVDTLEVFYGNIMLPQKFWSYDPEKVVVRIVLPSDLSILKGLRDKKAALRVKYDPILSIKD